MLHTATRRAMRYGRSYVLTVPFFVAQKLNVQRGDTFVIVFDDERNTLTYQRVFQGQEGPKVIIGGLPIESVMMP
jgi:hypothetical protein